MRLYRVVAAAASLALLVPLAGCGSSTSTTSAATPSRDAAPPAAAAAPLAPCPDLEEQTAVDGGLPNLVLDCLGEGPQVRLSDLAGRPTVLNVWAAWCTNCEREMPLFAQAMADYGDEVRFLGVHYKATREAGLVAAGDFATPFPSLHDEDGDLVVAALGATAPPQTLFVDASGRVTGRAVGEILSQRELTGLIEEHLGVRA